MNNASIKYLSYGVGFSLPILLLLTVLGAMFFATDDKEELFNFRKKKNKNKQVHIMEIQGAWLGMKLASTDSKIARRLGVGPSERGAIVSEIEERSGWRARQAGVQRGDVIKAVNGMEVRDIADLYDVSRDVDVASAVSLDVLRWGQFLKLVLPAVNVPVAAAFPPQEIERHRTAPMMGRQVVNTGPAAQGNMGPQFFCSQHNRQWPLSSVQPNYRCPIGSCPLTRVR